MSERPSTTALVAGHTLRNEGAPYAKNREGQWSPVSLSWGYAPTGGSGHGMCSCGATSEILYTGGQRKQWHREHKAEVSS